ncbi:hypothetical protein E4T56_gene17873, partial [Termitomyces sp. T112]
PARPGDHIEGKAVAADNRLVDAGQHPVFRHAAASAQHQRQAQSRPAGLDGIAGLAVPVGIPGLAMLADIAGHGPLSGHGVGRFADLLAHGGRIAGLQHRFGAIDALLAVAQHVGGHLLN